MQHRCCATADTVLWIMQPDWVIMKQYTERKTVTFGEVPVYRSKKNQFASLKIAPPTAFVGLTRGGSEQWLVGVKTVKHATSEKLSPLSVSRQWPWGENTSPESVKVVGNDGDASCAAKSISSRNSPSALLLIQFVRNIKALWVWT